MQEDLLKKIPLTRSPFIFNPKPITLPYNYIQTPAISSLPILPDHTQHEDLSGDITTIENEIQAAKTRIDAWNQEIKDRKLREARKLAPGFLDTGVTMLTPTLVTKTEVQVEEIHKKEDYLSQFAGLKF